uniref:Uncharacterized protein n=1 Tax=Arundo donax TaxID=35708 RepID=A0A0A9C7Y6_ARUDO
MNPAGTKQRPPNSRVRFNWHVLYELKGFVQLTCSAKHIYHACIVFCNGYNTIRSLHQIKETPTLIN